MKERVMEKREIARDCDKNSKTNRPVSKLRLSAVNVRKLEKCTAEDHARQKNAEKKSRRREK